MRILLLLLAVSTVAAQKYCTKWHTTKPGDTCTSVANANGITKAELVKFNWYDMTNCAMHPWVCVSRSDTKPEADPNRKYCTKWYTPPARETSLTKSTCLKYSTTKPRCLKTHRVGHGDNCMLIWTKYRMTGDQFYDYNHFETCLPLAGNIDVCVKVEYDTS